jgi:agmatinase
MNPFLNVQSHIENAKILIQPVPYEKTTSYIKGTKKAPDSILEASNELETYDIETDSEPYTHGIHTLNPIKDLSKIKFHHKFTLFLGGEHTITYFILKNINQKNLSILSIDAHADLKDKFDNSKFSHACVMRRIYEINENIVLVGTRSIDIEEKSFIQKNKIPVFYMNNINPSKIIKHLKENVYITIDLDSLDPSIMPSVGNPEPNGISWNQLLSLLKEVFAQKNVISADIVELSPKRHDKISPYVAAKLAYKLIAYKLKNKKV